MNRKDFRPTSEHGYGMSEKDRTVIQSHKKVTNRKGVVNNFIDGKPSKTGNDSLSTDGNKLKSYNTVIATKQKDGTIVLNKTKYSSTTSRQQSELENEMKYRGIKYDVTGDKERGYEGEDFSKEEKEEHKGAKHYEELAKEHPEHKETLLRMAKNEREHEKRLKAIDESRKMTTEKYQNMSNEDRKEYDKQQRDLQY